MTKVNPTFISAAVIYTLFSLSGLAQPLPGSCETAIYEIRSKELQKLGNEDQSDRQVRPSPPDLLLRDKARRMRVGEIFGEGCFRSAADYEAAALVYQHGNLPDHFYQTFLWARRAVELGGPPTSKMIMAFGIDRYLMNVGKKQLFGSQVVRSTTNPDCWCLQPVEPSFPESKRVEYINRPLADSHKRVIDLNRRAEEFTKGVKCPAVIECATGLIPSPAGTVPGLW